MKIAGKVRVFVSLFVLSIGLTSASAQQSTNRGEGELREVQPTGITPDEIIRRFAAKETEFKLGREKYAYTQEVKVQTLEGNTVDGEYRQTVDITYDDRGRRVETVKHAPQPTLKRISMSREDFQDIQSVMPFVLTTEEIPLYNIRYVGQQRQDELSTYVFDISPRQIEKGRRYFEGRIWVDDQDLQIVKTHGKSVPDIREKNSENLFPKFTTWREQVNGYWFPTYTRADDVLRFSSGDVRIRIIIKYSNYKYFGSDHRITKVEEVPTTTTPKPQ
jgi:hypothetical protein